MTGGSHDRDGSDDPDPPSWATPCPRCGTPILRVSVAGPLEATAGPCGCPVSPGILDRRSDGDPDSRTG
ncbi:hypothetical protein [Halopiger djelfimassiliensis]|uniref:hypothetical protein n=1 Tax=Halopiger djelfimassiliensis TaxID=1293047 RepID=UPI000677F798|nr:hypothetical protein [Halopiger djelfimassiliensis]